MKRASLIAIFVLLLCSSVFAQEGSKPVLTIRGEVTKQVELTVAEFAKLTRQTVKAKDHSGTEATYEGVALVEVLKLAGVKFGEELRGKNLALFLVVDAADGYKAVFALPELDPAYNEKQFLLVDKRDGKLLSERDGPLQIIVPAEKRQARWVRQVVSLTIKRAE